MASFQFERTSFFSPHTHRLPTSSLSTAEDRGQEQHVASTHNVIAFWPDRYHARASPPVIDGRKARYFCINAAPKALHGLKYPPSVEEKVGIGFVARMRTSRSLAEATHMATTATSAITTLSLRQGSSECASVWTSCEARQQSSEARPHDRGR